MKLLGNRLLVEPIVADSIGSIVLPESLKDDNNVGGPKVFRVIQIGTGRLTRKGVRIPIEAAPGDRVICHSYTSGPEPLGDKRKVITEEQIIAILPCPTQTQPDISSAAP